MKVVVFGAAGIVGRQCVLRLLEQGDSVVAVLHRSSELHLVHRSLEVVWGDLLSPINVARALRGAEAVVHAATAIPAPGSRGDWSNNDELRTRGTEILIEAARKEGVLRLLFQSVAMLCRSDEGELVDEQAPVRPSPVTASAAEMESVVRGSCGASWSILRGGLLYGPGTGRSVAWNAAARDGRLILPVRPTRYVSPIHLADFGRAVAAVLHADCAAGEVFNVVDDVPVTWTELFAHIAAANGQRSVPQGDEELLPAFRASNERLRRLVGWRPAYPSYLSGWPSA